MILPTGFCWECGRPCKANLFCNDKHKQKYEAKQRREQNKYNGKRAGYGVTGSTH